METAAAETRTNPGRLLTTALLTGDIALAAWSVAAQPPDVTDVDMRDRRAKAQTAETTASPRGFTRAELRDLRDDAKLLGSGKGGGPAFHGLTVDERADLRSASRTTHPHVSTPGFTVDELSDLRAEPGIVFPHSSGPVRAFTEAEIRDLRSLAHDA